MEESEPVEIKTVGVDKVYIPKVEKLIENYRAGLDQLGIEIQKIDAILTSLSAEIKPSEIITEVIFQYKKQRADIVNVIEESNMRIRAAEDLKKGLESGNPETVNLIANFCQAFGL